MDGIEEKAIELIEKFEALAVDVAPDAIELGLGVARVAAWQQILWLAIPLAIFFLSFRRPWPFFKLAGEIDKEKDDRWRRKEEIGAFLKGSAWAGTAAIGGIVSLAHISLWPFVGIFYPELWIAKQVLGW